MYALLWRESTKNKSNRKPLMKTRQQPPVVPKSRPVVLPQYGAHKSYKSMSTNSRTRSATTNPLKVRKCVDLSHNKKFETLFQMFIIYYE